MDTARAPSSAEQFIAAASAYPMFARDADAEAFLRALFQDIADNQSPVGDTLALAHDFWVWAREQGPGEQAVRLRPTRGEGGRPLGRLALEIVGPDMPFLVDSVMGEFADQGIAALAMHHPVAPGAGGVRSYIQIQLAPISDVRAAALVRGVRATLADVRTIVADFALLKGKMSACAAELEHNHGLLLREDADEAVALLRWLLADRFTFLGARDYEYAKDGAGNLLHAEPVILQESGLGLLRDPERYVLRSSAEPMLLTSQWERLLNEPTALVVAKSTLRSRVHRRTPADYVGVKRYAADGALAGETRFIGLLTTEAFTDPTHSIPMLRRRVSWVMEGAGFRAGGHSAKSLRHVIETYPREELWQISQEELLETARGIVRLLDRPRPALFIRRDRFDRFVSALVFLPKERFNTTLREAVGRLLEEAYGGRVESFAPTVGEGPLARVHFIIGEIDAGRARPDPGALEERIVALTRTWEDAFEEALSSSAVFDDVTRTRARNMFDGAFSASYRENVSPEEALGDVIEILGARGDEAARVRSYRRVDDAPETLRCKIYASETLPLSATLPIFEHMGLFALSEREDALNLTTGEGGSRTTVYVHDLEMRSEGGAAIDLGNVDSAFEAAFGAIWAGAAESDGFNKLILKIGVGWRECALLRALARYRQQSGLDPSQVVQEAALAAHPQIAALILALFRVRFDPELPEDVKAREAWAGEINGRISRALNDVPSLDDDRVLRRIAQLVGAIQRTNYFQRGADGALKSSMSFKIASQALTDLPAPKPYREIWVSGPQVEGVHLRFGPIARGGLRWSDRRDDFRTEVLDLVKAQQVKNAIIVPVGAKGGFFPKKLPARGTQGYHEAGVAAYRTFLRGLLDITDDLDGEKVTPPKDVVRWDGDDPYLVVAADKGTATFSDIANDLAAEYGFWLGDAFASGGSRGYDHKAMGITARGAWEAVKRHFREIGKNNQEEAFDVIGVGDMSGDVFGNGMLLSKKIRLLAAFDHRHIFIDPAPLDLDAAWAERKRLFELPRSTWDHYEKALISEGGGVFARTLKSIPISPQIAKLTGASAQALTPDELIRALLRSKCELLWFGGIGAYVKARAEPHLAVGDKSNDGVRVDAEDVKALVIGEGANLGVTQAGRIAFARSGGRINTDAVDNSAGVDTSDHEVNIKILLADVIRSGALKSEERDALLAEMTEDVGRLVLKDNYDQTGALTLAEATAGDDLDSHERMMERLEGAGKLSRAVEGLPDAAAMRALGAARLGLTRPELAKLLAYAKIDLFDALMASKAPDDGALQATLTAYFPPQLASYEVQISRHRLRRAIIATSVADDLVNMGGPTFVERVRDTVRAEPPAVALAFEAARRIYKIDNFTARVNALDNHAPASAQTRLHAAAAAAMRRAVIYLVRHGRIDQRGIAGCVAAYADAVTAQREAGAPMLTEVERARVKQARLDYVSAGAPDDLALEAALFAPMTSALDVADLADRRRVPVMATARLYRAIGAAFGLDALRAAASGLRLEAHWDRLAMRRSVEALFDHQRALTDMAALRIGDSSAFADEARTHEAVTAWMAGLGPAVDASRATVAELERDGGWSFAKLTLAAAELQALVEAAGR